MEKGLNNITQINMGIGTPGRYTYVVYIELQNINKTANF